MLWLSGFLRWQFTLTWFTALILCHSFCSRAPFFPGLLYISHEYRIANGLPTECRFSFLKWCTKWNYEYRTLIDGEEIRLIFSLFFASFFSLSLISHFCLRFLFSTLVFVYSNRNFRHRYQYRSRESWWSTSQAVWNCSQRQEHCNWKRKNWNDYNRRIATAKSSQVGINWI